MNAGADRQEADNRHTRGGGVPRTGMVAPTRGGGVLYLSPVLDPMSYDEGWRSGERL